MYDEDEVTEVTLPDVVQAVAELANTQAALTEQLGELRLGRAQDEIDGYIRAGQARPEQRQALTELALTDRDTLGQVLAGQDSDLQLTAEGVPPVLGGIDHHYLALTGAPRHHVDSETVRLQKLVAQNARRGWR